MPSAHIPLHSADGPYLSIRHPVESRRIGLDIRQLILERNALDFAMYTIVKERFMQRCGHVRD